MHSRRRLLSTICQWELHCRTLLHHANRPARVWSEAGTPCSPPGEPLLQHTNKTKVKLNVYSNISLVYFKRNMANIYLQVLKQPPEGEDSCCVLIVSVVSSCSCDCASLYLQAFSRAMGGTACFITTQDHFQCSCNLCDHCWTIRSVWVTHLVCSNLYFLFRAQGRPLFLWKTFFKNT